MRLDDNFLATKTAGEELWPVASGSHQIQSLLVLTPAGWRALSCPLSLSGTQLYGLQKGQRPPGGPLSSNSFQGKLPVWERKPRHQAEVAGTFNEDAFTHKHGTVEETVPLRS